MENTYFLVVDNIREIMILSPVKIAYFMSISHTSYKNFFRLINNNHKDVIHHYNLNDFPNLLYAQILCYHENKHIDKLSNLQHINLRLPKIRETEKVSIWSEYVTVHSRLENKKVDCISSLKKLTRIDFISSNDHINKQSLNHSSLRIVTFDNKMTKLQSTHKFLKFLLPLSNLERFTMVKELDSNEREQLISMHNLTYLRDWSLSNKMKQYLDFKGLKSLDCSEVELTSHLNSLKNLQKLSLTDSYGKLTLTNLTSLKLYYCSLGYESNIQFPNLQRLKFKSNGNHPDTFTSFHNLTKLTIDMKAEQINSIHDRKLKQLTLKINALTNLKDLMFCSDDHAVSESNIVNLNGLINLEKLHMSIFVDEDINISKLNKLTHLKFHRCQRKIICPVTLTSLIVLEKDFHTQPLDYSTWTNIQRLNCIDQKERYFLSKLTRLQSLATTFVDMKNIDLNRFIYLTSLHLDNSGGAGDRGYKDFQKFATLTNLLELYVYNQINTRYLDKLSNLTYLKYSAVTNYRNEIERLIKLRVLQIHNTEYVKVNKSRMKKLHTFEETQLKD